MFAVGVGIERVAYAPLRGRSVHVVVIATLGVALVIRTILGLWQGTSPRSLQTWFGAGNSLDNFLFFQDGVLRIDIDFLGVHDAVVSAQRVVIIVVTAITVVAMMLLFSRTSFGRQVRALAADRETARLYGVKATRLSMLAFGIASLLAGLGGLMIGPLGSFDLTLGLLVHAPRVRGCRARGVRQPRWRRPRCVADRVHRTALRWAAPAEAGGALGGDPANVLKYRSVFPYVLMLVVIAIRPQGLFGRRSAGCDRQHRTHDHHRSTAGDAGYPYLWLVVFLEFMVALRFIPQWGNDQTFLFNLWLVYTVMVVGFYFVFGLSGQFAFSQAAFAMVGGYTSAWATRQGMNFIVAVAFGIASPRVIAIAFAWVARRANLFFLAIATLALSEIINQVITQWNQFTGVDGAELHDVKPIDLFGWTATSGADASPRTNGTSSGSTSVRSRSRC